MKADCRLDDAWIAKDVCNLTLLEGVTMSSEE